MAIRKPFPAPSFFSCLLPSIARIRNATYCAPLVTGGKGSNHPGDAPGLGVDIDESVAAKFRISALTYR
jgi:L-alanine-DL-glutamate epimerase-like enolase superfamily enzyme